MRVIKGVLTHKQTMTNQENKEQRYALYGCCAQYVNFTVDKEGRVWGMKIEGSCPGMKTALCALAEGRSINVLIKALGGIKCRTTGSCPSQIAKAFQKYLEKDVTCKTQ